MPVAVERREREDVRQWIQPAKAILAGLPLTIGTLAPRYMTLVLSILRQDNRGECGGVSWRVGRVTVQ